MGECGSLATCRCIILIRLIHWPPVGASSLSNSHVYVATPLFVQVYLEEGIAPHVKEQLAAMGHRVCLVRHILLDLLCLIRGRM